MRLVGRLPEVIATRHRAGALPLLLIGLVALPAAAQRDSATVRTVSAWQRDVERLTKELVEQRRMEQEFVRLLADLETKLRSPAADSLRSDYAAQSQFVAQRLRATGVAQLRLRRDLESMCSSVPKPEGWLGVVTTGFMVYDRQGGGPQVVRFMEQPVVESVDPGSPADRVGLRSGDVLLEIGGQPLLHRDIVFAELLRPGERIMVKARRGGDVVSLTPLIEPLPTAMTRTPCSWVDAVTAYVLSPAPGDPAFDVTVSVQPGGGQGYAFSTPRRSPRDSTPPAPVRVATGTFAGPMAQFFTRGVNPVAGLQMVVVNPDLARAFGVEHGLVVLEALPGTPGRESGLRGGDVIISANDVETRSAATLQRVITQAGAKRSVNLVIVRDRKREKITLAW